MKGPGGAFLEKELGEVGARDEARSVVDLRAEGLGALIATLWLLAFLLELLKLAVLVV